MYATEADLKNKLDEATLIQLTDDADTGAIVSAVIDAALEAADVEIDGYLSRKYTLPLANTPPLLLHMAADIAIVSLYSRRGGPPEHWQKRYENHIAFLGKVVSGEIALGVNAPDAGASVKLTNSERIFSREKLKGF